MTIQRTDYFEAFVSLKLMIHLIIKSLISDSDSLKSSLNLVLHLILFLVISSTVIICSQKSFCTSLLPLSHVSLRSAKLHTRSTSIVSTYNKFLSLNKRLEVYISESNGFVNIYRFITGGKLYNSKTSSKSRGNLQKFPQLFEL